MASTRNKNTANNYCIQQREFSDNYKYNTNVHSQWGEAYTTNLPTYGLNPPSIPRNKLCNNSVEVESFLFGINSTNLVKPRPPVKPSINHLDNLTFFEKLPLQLPEPLVIKHNQRPNW
tara:strand:+ start:24482 stop:24835 length:354 start_codon:yes stop_codon:yes gene_type:complete